jgi:hypothetical protein
MQDTAVAVASLVYGAAALEAWIGTTGGTGLKLRWLAIYPVAFLAFVLVMVLLVPFARAALRRHLWISYRTGFGQSVISVLGGLGLLVILAVITFWPLFGGARGRFGPGAGFFAYAGGIGLLLAQAILVRRIEADPVLRGRIEVGEPL